MTEQHHQQDQDQEQEPAAVREGCQFARYTNGDKNTLSYASYLNLDRLLSCQTMVECGKYTHDQHLFQITHQVYELWFKQIIFELDSIRGMFRSDSLDERNMRVINNRLQRVVLILKTLVDQISILETMTALDFMDFRDHLQAASGFQSLQFRLLENKFGVKEDSRINYNKKNYKSVFDSDPESRSRILGSVEEESLKKLVERWLERTPISTDGKFGFWEKYCDAVRSYLKTEFEDKLKEMKEGPAKSLTTADWLKEQKSYETILDEDQYNEMLKRGEKSFSHKAFRGAVSIALYRDEPRFSQPYEMVALLVDIDSHITKWRYNHVVMVQRMIGSKLGTGGSSGYQYLRSTISDRYMPFSDLFNISTYLIPREYIPPLDQDTRYRLTHLADESRF